MLSLAAVLSQGWPAFGCSAGRAHTETAAGAGPPQASPLVQWGHLQLLRPPLASAPDESLRVSFGQGAEQGWCRALTCMMAVRQASVAEISSLAASRAVVLMPVSLWVEYWKSDSGASSLQTLPTIMLMTAKVPSAQHSEVRALLWSVLPWKALRRVRLSRVAQPITAAQEPGTP